MPEPMQDDRPRMTTRGRLLRRLGLVTGGAIAAAVPAAAGAASPRTREATAERLTFTVADLHGHTEGKRFGELPRAGDRTVSHGTIVDARGTTVGHVLVTAHHTSSPIHVVEQHLLTLPGGKLVGLGSPASGDDEFAIVGGTGRYATARGSYRALLSPRGLAGDGTGTLTLTLSS